MRGLGLRGGQPHLWLGRWNPTVGALEGETLALAAALGGCAARLGLSTRAQMRTRSWEEAPQVLCANLPQAATCWERWLPCRGGTHNDRMHAAQQATCRERVTRGDKGGGGAKGGGGDKGGGGAGAQAGNGIAAWCLIDTYLPWLWGAIAEGDGSWAQRGRGGKHWTERTLTWPARRCERQYMCHSRFARAHTRTKGNTVVRRCACRRLRVWPFPWLIWGRQI